MMFNSNYNKKELSDKLNMIINALTLNFLILLVII